MATLEELLQTTSRTFAIAIPLLPEPERSDVTLGYLVFRIADTLEDAENLLPEERIAALSELAAILTTLDSDACRRFAAHWSARRPSDDEHYQQLMIQAADVLLAVADRPPKVRDLLTSHARRSIAGMIETLREADTTGGLCLDSLEHLRDYCYYVAGIVGEMLTGLFLDKLAPGQGAEQARATASAFGEGLQLVNILKDAEADAANGRRYLPQETPLPEVFALARYDLEDADKYIRALQAADAPAGYVAFTRLPRELAVATLDKLEAEGPGAKLSRPEVASILDVIQQQTLASVSK